MKVERWSPRVEGTGDSCLMGRYKASVLKDEKVLGIYFIAFWIYLILPVHPKGNQSWIFIGRTGAEAEALIFGHLMQRTDSLEKTLMLGRIQGRREGNDRGWDGCMASPTPWTWVSASSGSWWWTGRPGALQSKGYQTGWHDLGTELNWF